MNRDQGEAGEGTGGEGRTRREDKGEQGRVREARRWVGWGGALEGSGGLWTRMGPPKWSAVTGCGHVYTNTRRALIMEGGYGHSGK